RPSTAPASLMVTLPLTVSSIEIAPIRRACRLPRTRLTTNGVASSPTSRLPATSSTSTVTPLGTAIVALSRSVTSATPALVSTRGAVFESISTAERSVPVIFRFPAARITRTDSTPSSVEMAIVKTSVELGLVFFGIVERGERFLGRELAALQIGQDRAPPRAAAVRCLRRRLGGIAERRNYFVEPRAHGRV